MKHFVNSTLRLLLTAIGLSLAAVSAYLTAIFLYDFGSSTGYSIAFSVSGVLLDLAKTFLPVAAVLAFRNNYKAIGLAGVSLCLVMMFTSYTISVSALKQSATEQSTQAIESRHHQEAIDSLRSQITTKEKRIERLRAVKYHTQADELQLEVDQLYSNLRTLLKAEVKISSNSFDITSAKILAALIEITATVTLIMVSAIGRPLVHEPEVVPNDPEAPAAEPFNDPLDDLEHFELPIAEVPEIVPPAKPDEIPPMILKAKEILAGGQARPSERSLSDALEIKRPEAAAILADLEESGFLVRDGRVRVLA